jgi:hypothetical protein
MKKQNCEPQGFFSCAAAYILGRNPNIKFVGPPEVIQVTKDVVMASRALYESLDGESVTITEVRRLLDHKRKTADRFNNVTGMNWIL